jgi:hypothetical protein
LRLEEPSTKSGFVDMGDGPSGGSGIAVRVSHRARPVGLDVTQTT